MSEFSAPTGQAGAPEVRREVVVAVFIGFRLTDLPQEDQAWKADVNGAIAASNPATAAAGSVHLRKIRCSPSRATTVVQAVQTLILAG